MSVSSWSRLTRAAVASLLLCMACQPSPAIPPTPLAHRESAAAVTLTPAPGVPGNPEHGRALIMSKGCAGCHTVRGVDRANGVVGPRLNNTALRPTLAGDSIPNSPEIMTRWIMDPQSLKPGTTMPQLGLTEQEAQDITAYLYSQPMNPGG